MNFHLENSKGGQGLCVEWKVWGGGRPQARPVSHQGAHRAIGHSLLWAPQSGIPAKQHVFSPFLEEETKAFSS